MLESHIDVAAFLTHSFIVSQGPSLSILKRETAAHSISTTYSNNLVVSVTNTGNTQSFLITIVQAGFSNQNNVDAVDDDDDENVQAFTTNLASLGDYNLPLESEKLPSVITENFNRMISSKIKKNEWRKLLLQSSEKSDKKSESHNGRPAAELGIPLVPNSNDDPTITTTTTRRTEPLRPSDMPDFDDEYEILNASQRNTNAAPTNFPSIGDRDLNPPGIGRYPPMKPYLDPLNRGGDGGMIPSPSHPLFGDRNLIRDGSSRLGVPPGARFDDPVFGEDLDPVGQGLSGRLRKSGGNSNLPGFGGFPGSGFNGGFGGGFNDFI